jgi:hypothetical protein
MVVQDVSIGADIEWFVRRLDNGTIVSAEPYVKGTKKDPHKFAPNQNAWYATQLDNVLAEGNIPPARTANQFVTSIQFLRRHLDIEVLPDGLATCARGAAFLPESELQTENAKTFGCDPSYNVWTGEEEVTTPSDPCLRTAGFHIHIGYRNPTEFTNKCLVRAMDAFLGVPSVLLEADGTRMKNGYGRAGNYRNQKWGVEYRTLSSFFVSDDSLVEWVWRNTWKAIDRVNDGLFKEPKGDGSLARVINDRDAVGATSIIRVLKVPMPGD